jgi:hypothetical protein
MLAALPFENCRVLLLELHDRLLDLKGQRSGIAVGQ